jgi:hypothetical protein
MIPLSEGSSLSMEISEIYSPRAQGCAKQESRSKKRICSENGIMSDPDECFRYMGTLPEKDHQLSLFE